MTTIVTRAGKGSALTHNEVDSNFINLNNAKYESGNNATFGTVGATAITGTSFSNSGNLTFTGTGNRIIGDFSNGTIASRVAFQTSTTNSNTALVTIPNGTATFSGWQFVNNSDPTNGSFLQVGASSSVVGIVSSYFGTGSFLPMTFTTGGLERMRIDSFGNVGIGTSSPSSLLTVNGEIQVRNANTQQGKIYGTGSALRIENTSSTPIVFLQNTGTEYMRIASNGNVGIGTSSPAQILDVVKSVAAGAVWGSFSNTNATAGSTGGILTSASGANNYSALYNVVGGITYLLGAGAGGLNISTSQAVPIVFNTSASERMRIDSNGNVCIGISTASAKLHVNGGEIRVSNADYGRVMFQRGSSALWEVGPRNTDDFYVRRETGAGNVIFEGGNVGIGAASGGAKLHVQQDQAAYSYLDFYNVTNGGGVVWRQITRNLANTGTTSVDLAKLINSGFTINNNDTGSGNFTSFGVGGSERMRIDSNGNVLIRTTSSAGANFEVNGSMYNRDGYAMLGAYNSNGAYPPLSNVAIAFAWNFTAGGRENVIMNNDTGGGGFRFLQRTGTSTSNYLGRTDNNGVWYQGNNSSSWSTTSDARIKTNIREINGALDKINALHPCHFEYIDKAGKTKTGFIAQEFEQVLSGHIVEEATIPDAYKELIPEGEKLKGIDADLIPYLTKAIQELSAKVDTLQAELNTLKGN